MPRDCRGHLRRPTSPRCSPIRARPRCSRPTTPGSARCCGSSRMRAGSSVEVLIALAGLLLACGCQRSATPVSSLRAASTSPSVERPQPQTSADDAANVVRAYYRAIDERRYGDAYRQWASDGAASGKSFEAFRDGFASTATVDVAPGPPGPIEGAAWSRYGTHTIR